MQMAPVTLLFVTFHIIFVFADSESPEPGIVRSVHTYKTDSALASGLESDSTPSNSGKARVARQHVASLVVSSDGEIDQKADEAQDAASRKAASPLASMSVDARGEVHGVSNQGVYPPAVPPSTDHFSAETQKALADTEASAHALHASGNAAFENVAYVREAEFNWHQAESTWEQAVADYQAAYTEHQEKLRIQREKNSAWITAEDANKTTGDIWASAEAQAQYRHQLHTAARIAAINAWSEKGTADAAEAGALYSLHAREGSKDHASANAKTRADERMAAYQKASADAAAAASRAQADAWTANNDHYDAQHVARETGYATQPGYGMPGR